ncbi:pyruvate decarboxylase [Trichoderma reesei QM6a]|jgi:pyruvate decarboxylase|uniref:Pyruvate decarboxylase n=2 Tax=Hypocrea jecorina TaxID=51453 RepID=G0RFU0_HYPJQ|nr:pyruvate decarboxylase [Trichoderma reesei QM6a]EGR49968.1 pyruvate decarboxylase [Trichoderma reesei QM6a]ETS03360.1 pyruvate decarboxylase [Trichoderma reesei RUT C-30]
MANPDLEVQGTIDLAEYIYRRLIQLGVGTIHGVPGDYNLTALDYIKPLGLTWAGNGNELNSGYAADGYGRIKGIAAVITAFGVGELSAINAIGGAFAERSPVVHIVGTPPLAAQKARVCMHHTLGNGDYRAFSEMNKYLTVAQASLTDAETAPALVDAALKACVLNSQPVYILLPTNLVHAQVHPPTVPMDLSHPAYDEGYENKVLDTLVEKMQSSKKPVILMDGLTARFHINEEINEFVRLTGFPTLSHPFGKGVVNENLPNYYGSYEGAVGDESTKQQIDDSDLVLSFGPLYSDVNSMGFSSVPRPEVTVTFESHSVRFGTEAADPQGRALHIQSFMTKLIKRLKATELPRIQPFTRGPSFSPTQLQSLKPAADGDAIKQDEFWLRMSEYLKPGDLLVTEAGTPFAGGNTLILPENTILINSCLWLSIGFTLPALQGAALAQREQRQEGHREGARTSGRAILFIGDGSLQMSVQAIGDIIRNRLDATIIVINNDGYTVERVLHGFKKSYNEIQPWRNTLAPSFFGAPEDDPEYPMITAQARNWGELRSVWGRKDVQAGKGLTLIEVFMHYADAPRLLKKLAAYFAEKNKANEARMAV